MNRETLDKLTNLTARIDLTGIDAQTEGLNGRPMTDADRIYLRQHGDHDGADMENAEISDVTDFCAGWRLTAQVFFAGKHVANVDAKGDVTIL